MRSLVFLIFFILGVVGATAQKTEYYVLDQSGVEVKEVKALHPAGCSFGSRRGRVIDVQKNRQGIVEHFTLADDKGREFNIIVNGEEVRRLDAQTRAWVANGLDSILKRNEIVIAGTCRDKVEWLSNVFVEAKPTRLVCVRPVFIEERRIIEDPRTNVEHAAQAIHYLRSRYCALMELDDSGSDGVVMLSHKCWQVTGIRRGERVFWGFCEKR